jgi:hypothetical protein
MWSRRFACRYVVRRVIAALSGTVNSPNEGKRAASSVTSSTGVTERVSPESSPSVSAESREADASPVVE